MRIKKLHATDREMTTPLFLLRCVQLGISIRDLNLLTIGMVNDMFWRAETMSIRDGDRLPHRRILTGSDLMKCDDRISEKRYNDFMKSEAGGNIHENCDY